MRLLISDANILIDMEAGALLPFLFRLPVTIGIPDLLYYEEIAPGTPGLETMGLQILEVHGESVRYAAELPTRYNHTLPANSGARPSHHDYMALALAKQEACTLLTGDANLRRVAEAEQIHVMGSIGLLCAMIKNQLLTVDDDLYALQQMKQRKRRLPWQEAEKQLNALRYPHL